VNTGRERRKEQKDKERNRTRNIHETEEDGRNRNITRTIRRQLGYWIEGETINACKIFMLEPRGPRRC
jgi:hypothetical protein